MYGSVGVDNIMESVKKGALCKDIILLSNGMPILVVIAGEVILM